MMVDGRSILTFLNSREEFWYWGINNIQTADNSLSFTSIREKGETQFVIEIGEGGFIVKLFRPALLKKRKCIKTFKKVQPQDLSEVINNVVFQAEAA